MCETNLTFYRCFALVERSSVEHCIRNMFEPTCYRLLGRSGNKNKNKNLLATEILRYTSREETENARKTSHQPGTKPPTCSILKGGDDDHESECAPVILTSIH